jgi:cell division septation protein DedD
MAARQVSSSGLTIGQVFTLSFGFILASVLIFALGWWVGYDAAQQRRGHDRQPVRVAVVPPQMPAVAATVGPLAAAGPPTATMTRKPAVPTPSHTPEISIRTMPPTRMPTRAPTASTTAIEERAGTGWSVQVKATTEALEAVMFARQLRQKGYDAYTVQAPIGSVTWYRVRVGRFADRASARATEQRLREQEKVEAAYVVNE